MGRAAAGDGFRIEEVALTGERLPTDAPPLRFAQLSDLHLRSVRDRHRRMVALLNERQPDFVCLTGDIIGSDSKGFAPCEELFHRLDLRGPVFACRGNWEVRSRLRVGELRRIMADWGVTLLVNEGRNAEAEAGPVRVGAVDDLSLGWPVFEEALDGAEDQRPAYSVLLSHAPLAVLFLDRDSGVDLVLSGHTHGGQMRVPLMWRWVLPACTGPFVAGLYELAWGRLYVNRGFGVAAMLPLRLWCPAEVTFFTVGPP
jgi:hypothetical protein